MEEVFSQKKECKYFYLQEINDKSLTSVQSLLEKMAVLCDCFCFWWDGMTFPINHLGGKFKHGGEKAGLFICSMKSN